MEVVPGHEEGSHEEAGLRNAQVAEVLRTGLGEVPHIGLVEDRHTVREEDRHTVLVGDRRIDPVEDHHRSLPEVLVGSQMCTAPVEEVVRCSRQGVLMAWRHSTMHSHQSQ